MRASSWPSIFALTLSLAACSTPKKMPDSFETTTHDSTITYSPKLAVVLGGGGIKGFVHVGVIKAFEEEGLKPDLIVGTSIGSLAGALWASGYSAAEIEKFALEIENADIFDWTLFQAGGFLKGELYEQKVRDKLQGKKFSELKIPFIAIATDLEKGTKTEFNSGDVAQAVRGSSSVAGIFIPAKIGKNLYLDGDYVGTVPVQSARQRNAKVIFAADISHALPPMTSKKASDVEERAQAILRRHQIDLELEQAQFSIRPLAQEEFNYRALMDRAKMIELGYIEAKKQIPGLKEALLLPAQGNNQRNVSSAKSLKN